MAHATETSQKRIWLSFSPLELYFFFFGQTKVPNRKFNVLLYKNYEYKSDNKNANIPEYITCACFSTKQEEEKASKSGASKCIKWQKATAATFSNGQTSWPATHQ